MTGIKNDEATRIFLLSQFTFNCSLFHVLPHLLLVNYALKSNTPSKHDTQYNLDSMATTYSASLRDHFDFTISFLKSLVAGSLGVS